MKVDGVGSARPAVTRRADRRHGIAGSFAAELPIDEARTAKASVRVPLTAVDAEIALQEVPDPNSGRGRAVQRAHALLDQLDEIRHGLLTGAMPVDRLSALAHALRGQRETVSDPALRAVLGEIETRALVELTKLELSR